VGGGREIWRSGLSGLGCDGAGVSGPLAGGGLTRVGVRAAQRERVGRRRRGRSHHFVKVGLGRDSCHFGEGGGGGRRRVRLEWPSCDGRVEREREEEEGGGGPDRHLVEVRFEPWSGRHFVWVSSSGSGRHFVKGVAAPRHLGGSRSFSPFLFFLGGESFLMGRQGCFMHKGWEIRWSDGSFCGTCQKKITSDGVICKHGLNIVPTWLYFHCGEGISNCFCGCTWDW